MDYKSIQELLECAEKERCSIWQVVLKDQAEQMEKSEEELCQMMDRNLKVMEEAVCNGMSPDIQSASGLSGKDAWKMQQYALTGGISGSFLTNVMARTLAVSEYNAAMGRIVAAPTAGSCGIMPGCLISVMLEKAIDREKILHAMFTAAGFGMVIANRASISGAQGGCQAECGSAAAMTAAALVEIMGGTPQQAADACAIAMKNQLGLVCDPVAGLVEVPCVKRNVGGAMIALSAADMALAGICSKIPVDEVIDAMRNIGDAMPCALKETAQGGLANTPTGIRYKEKIFGDTEKL